MSEDDKLSIIMHEAASFKLKHGHEEEAACLYEECVKSHGSVEALVRLVMTAAHVDVDKAEVYAKRLRKLPGLKEVNVESLERTSGAKHMESSHTVQVETSPEEGKEKTKAWKKRRKGSQSTQSALIQQTRALHQIQRGGYPRGIGLATGLRERTREQLRNPPPLTPLSTTLRFKNPPPLPLRPLLFKTLPKPLQFHSDASSALADVDGPTSESALSVPHPWPELGTFIERLKSKGYFDDPEAPPPPEREEGSVVEAPMELNQIKTTFLNFSRDRFDILMFICSFFFAWCGRGDIGWFVTATLHMLTDLGSFKEVGKGSRRQTLIRQSLEAGEFLNPLHGSVPLKVGLNRLENEVRVGNVMWIVKAEYDESGPSIVHGNAFELV
ncbi:hypothetical protein MRB53_019599 [Persea americana]|uniref:Uncharacterized protein n=1 Tax=Persea americana TaxID=3435 RepID=A0ACC2KYH9_PERAE|nr:hypothetical protein MRB53_019599 [Persea americana]